MQDWKRIIDQLNIISNKNNSMLIELINYQYGYIAWCIGNKKREEAEKYLNLAEKNIEFLEKENYNLSMVNAYKAAFYGYRIGLNSLLAPFIGPKSMDCAELSIKIDANNPFAYVQYANIQYYMPSIFGGSKTEALKHYIMAKELMEKNEASILENWNYLSLLTLIGKAYWDLDDFQSAKIYFEKIMKITSEYEWVRDEMYPQLLQKINNKK
jgi:tetratricopeptide (TPR) repeat protein